MDYEKKYNEALERARKIHNEILDNEILGFPDQIREIFPELSGLEDERIRNWLVDYFGSIKETVWVHRDITCEQILDWLEKQKEQKPAWSEEDEKMLKGTLDSLKRYQLSMPNYQVELQMRWLKFLRPSWKPSEEQMEALENSTALTEKQGAALYSLIRDLKKL